MTIDKISDIQLFIDASQLGSLSAAGRKHGLSPAAASACIQRMEAALRVRLFNRTTRRLHLTEEGKLYLQYCINALGQLSEGHAMLDLGLHKAKGRIKMSVPSDLGRHVVLDMLKDFQVACPECELTLHLSDSLANLVDDEIDIAIRYGKPGDSNLVARRLARNRRVVCASPSLLKRVGVPTHPSELARLPTLTLITRGGTLYNWRYTDYGMLADIRVIGMHQTNDGEILRQWAVQGLGFAYKSSIDIVEDLAAGRLLTVLDNYFIEDAPLHLLYHRSGFQSLRLRKLIDFLIEKFSRLRVPE